MTTHKRYIRFGDIPEKEVSGIYRGEVKIGKEKGVSVYDAVMINGQWHVVLPFPLMKEVGFDLYNFIQGIEYDEREYPTEHKPMYLVQGDEIGKGSTNEPLLRNVKIIEKLL